MIGVGEEAGEVWVIHGGDAAGEQAQEGFAAAAAGGGEIPGPDGAAFDELADLGFGDGGDGAAKDADGGPEFHDGADV